MAKIIAVTNQKGGVGKTTLSFNLGLGLAKRRHKVLMIDNDPQGNLTTSLLEDKSTLEARTLEIYKENFDVTPQNVAKNVDLIGANRNLAEVADKVDPYMSLHLRSYLRGTDSIDDLDFDDSDTPDFEPMEENYDFVIIDCLPSFGPLNVAALMAADHVVIPTKPAPYAIDGLQDLFKSIVKIKKSGLNGSLRVAGIVMNLVEMTNLHEGLEGELRETYGDYVFESIINKGTKLEESPYFYESVMDYAPKTKQTKQLNAFIREFLRRVN